MDIVQKITETIEPSLAAMGYGLVQVKLGDSKHKKTLTVMAERTDQAPMGMDDCVDISRHLSALLEVEDPISGAYDLEICSPGIDRPLTRQKDFARYAGSEARIETYAPIDGRRKFRGTLIGMEGENIGMQVEGTEIRIPFSGIRNARLMVSETLMNKRGQKK